MDGDALDRRIERDDHREPTRHAEKRARVDGEVRRELVAARTAPVDAGERALHESTEKLLLRSVDGVKS
jgi:hypothetical protein